MTTLLIGISIGFAIGVVYGTFAEKRDWERELHRISKEITGSRIRHPHPVTEDLIFKLGARHND